MIPALIAMALSQAAAGGSLPSDPAPAAPMAIDPTPFNLADSAQLLADRVEVAFRACTFQIAAQDYLTDKHSGELRTAGILLGGSPPEGVSVVAAKAFGPAPIYASVTAPSGALWIAASSAVAECKVFVADTATAFAARKLWAAKLRRTSPWGYDQDASGLRGTVLHQAFVLNPERPGAHMVVLIDGRTRSGRKARTSSSSSPSASRLQRRTEPCRSTSISSRPRASSARRRSIWSSSPAPRGRKACWNTTRLI